MRISSLYKIAFLSFFALTLTSCEDEPLDGDFPIGNANLTPSFTAKVDGANFVAATSFAITSDNKTQITGIKGNGDIIVMTYNGVGTGTFILSGTTGEGQFGINTDPDLFSTKHENVGGTITVAKYDGNTGHVSGTFAFTAAWPLKDANGQPILDNAGNPTFQVIDISEGKFSNVPLTGGMIDDGNIDLSVDISGKWALTAYNYSGENTTDVGGQPVTYQFTGVGSNMNAFTVFTRNPNIVTSSGNFTTTLTTTFMGQTTTNVFVQDHNDEGIWSQNGAILNITNPEMDQDYEIVALSQNHMKLYFEVKQVISGQDTEIEGYMTFQR